MLSHIHVIQVTKRLRHPLKSFIISQFEERFFDFVVKYIQFQRMKVECKHPTGLLQPFPVPEWKWEVISMDFIIGWARTSRQHDEVMVVVDRLSKVAHLLAVKSTNLSSEMAQVFIKEIVRRHGIPKKIISIKDVKFTSIFWNELFERLGT